MISLDQLDLTDVIIGYRNVYKYAKGTVYVAQNLPALYVSALKKRGLHVEHLDCDRFTLGKKLGRQNMVAVVGYA